MSNWQIVEGGLIRLNVLAGEGCSRETGTQYCTAEKGMLYDVDGAPMEEIGSELLLGWGRLDGPAVNVRPADCAWYVSVPLSAWEAAIRVAIKGTILGHAFEALRSASLHYRTATSEWTSRDGRVTLRGLPAVALRDLMAASKARTASLKSATNALRQRDYRT